jgi:hypothetical protein
MRRLQKSITTIFWCLVLAWALKVNVSSRKGIIYPKKNINHVEFRKQVRDGDLLATLASNNVMNRFHTSGLNSPISHVGIAIVEKEGDENGRVYMFEASALRGAQLRDLDEYMKDGAEQIWWRSLKASRKERSRVVKIISQLSRVAYSWAFLKTIPRELIGFDAPGAFRETDMAFSCAELIAMIYLRSGFKMSSINFWLPVHFLGPMNSHEDSVNVIFEGLKHIHDKRYKSNIEKLGLAIYNALELEEKTLNESFK